MVDLKGFRSTKITLQFTLTFWVKIQIQELKLVYLKGVRLTKLASNLQFYPTLAFTVMVLYVYTILKGFSDHSIQDFGHESCSQQLERKDNPCKRGAARMYMR